VDQVRPSMAGVGGTADRGCVLISIGGLLGYHRRLRGGDVGEHREHPEPREDRRGVSSAGRARSQARGRASEEL